MSEPETSKQTVYGTWEEADEIPYYPNVFEIFKDRLGRYVFEPVRIGLKDCCGFVYRIFGRSVK